MKLTIIVPAYNEEAYLPSTLDSIQTAAAHLRTRSKVDIDMLVVDNNSKDKTAAVAQNKARRWSMSRCSPLREPETPERDTQRVTYLSSSTRIPSCLTRSSKRSTRP